MLMITKQILTRSFSAEELGFHEAFSGEDGPVLVAEEIGAACESLGFLIVTGHGVASGRAYNGQYVHV